MFRGGGYTEDVDWWSLGVTFYECVFGTVSEILYNLVCLFFSFFCVPENFKFHFCLN
jgi:serine/threonine protein kinase